MKKIHPNPFNIEAYKTNVLTQVLKIYLQLAKYFNFPLITPLSFSVLCI